ncbi:hypothetical protein O0L34_g3959 [Tuta absoluta]|nr:hypothetical protein O0L34_g3959 [Tuta absoluta]
MWSKLVVLAVALVAYAEGYSSGAPDTACQDMVPKHPVAAQKVAAPYIVTTSTKVVKAGQPMQVVISGKSASNTIGGLLLQARVGNKPVGTFSVPAGDRFAQLLNCGSPGNAVTHKKHGPNDEKQTVAFTWTPPKDLIDEIKFRATVAYNGAVFWVGVESAPVKVTA